MSSTLLAAALLPLFMFVLSLVLLNPAKRLVQRKMKDGPLKRLLLTRTN